MAEVREYFFKAMQWYKNKKASGIGSLFELKSLKYISCRLKFLKHLPQGKCKEKPEYIEHC